MADNASIARPYAKAVFDLALTRVLTTLKRLS